MDKMFSRAASFRHKLCGPAWVQSTASKTDMFLGSFGSLSRTVCTSAKHTLATMQTTHRYVSRRPNPERELITRSSISTPFTSPRIADTLACPKCDTFEKSGRVSCCAPGGAWYNSCGGAGNKNVKHRWFEGLDACKRKSKEDGMYIMNKKEC